MSLVSLKRWKEVIARCSVVIHFILVTAWRVDRICPHYAEEETELLHSCQGDRDRAEAVSCV